VADVKLFLSCVSNEFGAWREALRHELTSLNLDIAIQEDFGSLGVDTLSKLDAYIRNCDAVIHLAGAKAGAAPNDFVAKRFIEQLADLEKRLPPLFAAMNAGAAIAYTQWEAWLALYYGKPLLIAQPDPKPPAGTAADGPDTVEALQAAHLGRLREVGIYPEIRFERRSTCCTHHKSAFRHFSTAPPAGPQTPQSSLRVARRFVRRPG
jgi:hypothetical protein